MGAAASNSLASQSRSIKSPGRLTFSDVTLERGATQDRDGVTLRRWSLSGAWPIKFVTCEWDTRATRTSSSPSPSRTTSSSWCSERALARRSSCFLKFGAHQFDDTTEGERPVQNGHSDA